MAAIQRKGDQKKVTFFIVRRVHVVIIDQRAYVMR